MTLRTHRSLLMLLVMLGLAGLYVIYAYNVFVDETLDTVHELEIELDEALAYGVMMTLAISGYAIRVHRDRLRDSAEQVHRLEEARRIGRMDALTGLANRRDFDATLAALLADAGSRRDAVLMIDLNGFKPVNDRFGHAAGDALLKVVAARLTAAVRTGDLAARVGGDEFAVIAPGAGDPDTARAIAERIIAGLEAPIDVDGTSHRIGAGIGIALAPADAREPADLVAAADRALYRAKAARATVAVFAQAA